MTLLAGYTGDGAAGGTDVTGNGHDFTFVGNTQLTASAGGYLHGGTTPTSKGITQSSTGTDAGPAIFGQTPSRSLSMWLKMPADFTGWVWEQQITAVPTGEWGLLCLSGSIGFRARNTGGTTQFASMTRVTDAAWHHYAGTFDTADNKVRLYYDGVLQVTTSALSGGCGTTANVLNAFDVTVGTPPTVDDIRIHNTALSAAEILAFMGNPPPDSSGSSFTQTPSDAEGLTDAVALALTRALSDNANPSDVATPMIFQQNQENLTLSDSVALLLSVGRSDPEGLTDAATFSIGPVSSDAEGLTDSVNAVHTAVQANSDDAGLTDNVSVLKSSAGDLLLTDPEGLTDSAGLSIARVLSDPIGMADTTAVTLSTVRADFAGTADAVGMDLGHPVNDLAGMVDAVFIELTTTATLADSLGMSDQVMIRLELAIADQLALDDDVHGLPATIDRDLTLVGYLLPGRYSGAIRPGRLNGEVRW